MDHQTDNLSERDLLLFPVILTAPISEVPDTKDIVSETIKRLATQNTKMSRSNVRINAY